MSARTRRVYLVVGQDDWRRAEAVDRIVAQHLEPQERALNLDRLDASEADVQEVLTKADTLPFFGQTRVVVVHGLDRMPAAGQERLAAYLEAGPPPSVLVLEARSLDRRRKLAAVLARVADAIAAEPLDARGAAAWAVARARSLGKRMTTQAARALVAAAGVDLHALAGEVDKLVAYAGDRPTVDVADVEAVAAHGAEVSVFALTDAVGEGHAEAALRVLHRLLERENPVGLLALLAGHFRALLYARALEARGASPAEVRAALGSRAWLYRRYQEQTKRFGHHLLELHQEIERADLALKTSGAPADVVLEGLVVRLCLARSRPSDAPSPR
jgi:DNA polymerase-3 subunit delta